jgi:hypothetical protein
MEPDQVGSLLPPGGAKGDGEGGKAQREHDRLGPVLRAAIRDAAMRKLPAM